MDFARKQLEKYGWKHGKGLGRNENGISEALKPKLKRSVAGIGHDAASDFTEHWWQTLYDKAANNVEVQVKNGKTKKIKTKENFEITNSMWKLKKKQKDKEEEEQYADFFVKKAILTSGGSKTKQIHDSSSEDEETEKKDVFKMTDEELFAACGGRTAHKGARHGLKALGKLARIEQQEQQLLQEPKYEGYSKSIKYKNKQTESEMVEETEVNNDNNLSVTKKKKKRKLKSEEDSNLEQGLAEEEELLPEKEKTEQNADDIVKHKKRKKKEGSDTITDVCEVQNDAVKVKKKRKKTADDL